MSTLKTYTVIGLWADTGQVWCEYVEAVDPGAALFNAQGAFDPEEADIAQLEIIGCIEGRHQLHCPNDFDLGAVTPFDPVTAQARPARSV